MSTEWLTEASTTLIVLTKVIVCIAVVPLTHLVISIAYDLVFDVWKGKERVYFFITMVIAILAIIVLFYIFIIFLQIEIIA